MNFKDLQDAVMSDRFREAQRGDIKTWINSRLGMLWDSADWTFKHAKTTVTVTAGENVVSGLPTDFGTVRALRRSDGTRLHYLDPDDFDDAYFGQTDTGLPYHFTVVNSAISVGPISSETNTGYGLFYNKAVTVLVDDNDTPNIPVDCHEAIVFGAAVEGLILQNDFTWQGMEQLWSAELQTMKEAYLIDHFGDAAQFGRLTTWD